jgi:flagellar hook-associated protein 1 FlgK
LLKPFGSAATNIAREFSTPSALAVASPIVGQMGATNTGSLQLANLNAGVNPPANVPVTVTFDTTTSPTSYNLSGPGPFPGGTGPFTYTSGQPITSGDTPASWSLTLQGAPQNGDTFSVKDIKTTSLDVKLNGGNATNMMNLRDVAMFDGAAMSDGYASLISQIGIRAQSANYSATVSSNIATTAEKDRTGIAGVNLDEEAAKLIQYQQAYQASAKMIQVAQSIFDTLIRTLA